MSSSTMPPPPSPLAHRRTRSSTSPSLDASTCAQRKMSLSKAETFHQPSSPSTVDDPVLSVSLLSKRSTTHTSSSFASWLYNGREAAADVLADFEQTFSGARGPRPATRRRSARAFEDNLLAKAQQRASSPVDSGIGSSVGSPSEKNLSRTLEKALDLTSQKDSALGSSIVESEAAASESLVQANSITEARHRRTGSSHQSELRIIRYPIPTSSTHKNTQPFLSQFARRHIYRRLYAPLLAEIRFEEFHSLVSGTRKNKNLRCLRDIEQSLINQPVTLTVTPALYRAFGELTVQLVIDTYQHLSESEQRRPTDRKYDNGYFLDLVQQVQQLAAHIGSSNTTVEDGSEPTVDDEITLEGGLGETGNLAELVRWKNGEGISLRTGLPYVPMPGVKRQASSIMADDSARSMARRKKNEIYVPLNLPCSQPNCDRTFPRQCDLAKHEKTHSRPYKCHVEGCKYHSMGLPTEKELGRHLNDRHNETAKMFRCKFCQFETKRESNCKQHMEKKHNWNYERSKGKDKATTMTPAQTPSTPAMGYHSVMPSPAGGSDMMRSDSSSIASSVNPSPFEAPMSYESPAMNFASFPMAQSYPNPLFPRPQAIMPQNEFDFNAPLETNFVGNAVEQMYPTPTSAIQQQFTPQTPAYSNITPSPMMMDNMAAPANFGAYNSGLPTPDSAHAHSRLGSHAFDVQQSMDFSGMNMMSGPMIGGEEDFDFNSLPAEDFTMFGAFTNAAAANHTLIPDLPLNNQTGFSVEDFSNLNNMDFNDNVMDQYLNDN